MKDKRTDSQLDAYSVSGSSPPEATMTAEQSVGPFITGWGRDGLVLILPRLEQEDAAYVRFIAVSDVPDIDVLAELRAGCVLLTFEDLGHRLGWDYDFEWPVPLVDTWRRAKRRFLKAHASSLAGRNCAYPPSMPDLDDLILTAVTRDGQCIYRGAVHMSKDEIIAELRDGCCLLTPAELLGQVWEERGVWPTEPLGDPRDLDRWDLGIVRVLSVFAAASDLDGVFAP